MSKTQELLEAARLALGGVTDYKLAQALELPRQTISHYRNGDRHADAYACTQIALVLHRDPFELIAMVEADTAKTEARREFWRSFPSGMRHTALSGALLLATSGFFKGGTPSGGGGHGTEGPPLRIMWRYGRRSQPKTASRPLGGFFLAVDLTQSRRKSRSRARKSTCHGTR